jgi:hypothetical protein
MAMPPFTSKKTSRSQSFSPLYVTKSVIDSGTIRGIICLLFLVKNRKEAEDGPGGFFRRN